MELRFVLGDGAMSILRDGEVIARAELGAMNVGALDDVTWGAGTYGAFGGAALDGEVVTAP